MSTICQTNVTQNINIDEDISRICPTICGQGKTRNNFGWDAKMEDQGSATIAEFDPSVESWMKIHTIGDLRNLASKLERKGVDTSEIQEFISELDTATN